MHKDDEWGNIELPGISDEELYSKNWNQKRTKDWKNGIAIGKKKYWDSEEGQKQKEKGLWCNSAEANEKFRLQQIKDRGVPILIIEPNGKEHRFEYIEEANQVFTDGCMPKHVWKLKPGESKRILRRKYKNYIIVRLDGDLDTQLLDELKEDVYYRTTLSHWTYHNVWKKNKHNK